MVLRYFDKRLPDLDHEHTSPSCHLPVSEAESQISNREDQELLVEQLVDTSTPEQQQLVEASKAGIGYTGCVSDSHGKSGELADLEFR